MIPYTTYMDLSQQKAVEVAEARSDVDIVCDLARKLGLANHFWNDAGELYDFLIKPTGLTFREFKEKKRIFAPLVYRRFEKTGFNTPSGKVELYSSLLEKNRCAPLPGYTEPFESPTAAPDRMRGRVSCPRGGPRRSARNLIPSRPRRRLR